MKPSTVSLLIAFMLAMEGSALANPPPPPTGNGLNRHTAGPAYGKTVIVPGGNTQTIIQGAGAGTSTQISIGSTGSMQISIQN